MAEKKAPQLHELIAVEGDLHNTTKAILDEAEVLFTKKMDHFMGQQRTLVYYDDARTQENEQSNKEIVTTVDKKLSYVAGRVSKYYDALLRKEEANQRAIADLVVEGNTLAENLPATFLLGMESRLKAVREILLRVPTLDPSVIWSEDKGAGDGVYRTEPIKTKRTEKAVRHKTLYEATKEHPAQIEKWNEDVPVASIDTIHRSGMWTPNKKAEVLDRIDTLLASVKRARQRANNAEVAPLKVGKTLFNYILNGTI